MTAVDDAQNVIILSYDTQIQELLAYIWFEKTNYSTTSSLWGGAVASWLVHSTPERVVRVRALAGDIVLCS